MEFTKARPLSLRAHAQFNERWLHERLIEDPSLLGLGDLLVRGVERRQPRAGRLDLLLQDPESGTRYEVEIQLGPTDESHIIRTIEYWDIEKARYPQYDHIAVLVAEDVTSRFLNVISLFNKAIPIMAIQINALEVGDAITLNATTVLDVVPRGTDEEDEPGQSVDRDYWISKGSVLTVSMADRMVALVNQVVPDISLKYNRHYIGLARGSISDLFVLFRPRKEHLIFEVRLPRSEELTALLDESGLDLMEYSTHWRRYRIRLSESDIESHRDVLFELIRRASGAPVPDEIE
jgi:hypothetical protein